MNSRWKHQHLRGKGAVLSVRMVTEVEGVILAGCRAAPLIAPLRVQLFGEAAVDLGVASSTTRSTT
jgi:hypothetical protein